MVTGISTEVQKCGDQYFVQVNERGCLGQLPHTKNLAQLAPYEPVEIFQNFGASRENLRNTRRRALKIGSPRFKRVAGALE